MPPRHILSPQSRTALFDPPTEPTAIVRHYTFSPEDQALIWQRRRAANRLGFAVHLAYLRFPGRVLGADDAPPADMLAFIASQIGCDADEFASYARRDETRREHLGELQSYLARRNHPPRASRPCRAARLGAYRFQRRLRLARRTPRSRFQTPTKSPSGLPRSRLAYDLEQILR
ncbi:MAG TPA: DUF4158 domain-containing protein [Methylocystis sp.]|nr:DUF4158 domain-containing protein [Methylocystis sp.]